MFVIASANPVPVYSTCAGTPTSSSSFKLDCMMSRMNITEDQKLGVSSSPPNSDGLTRSGKMRRCVFSMNRYGGRHTDEESDNHCSVEARQIEIGFVSIATKQFAIRVHAPNEEESELLEFLEYGRQCYFHPKQSGCGHGHWLFEMYLQVEDGSHLVYTQNVYLDGVGSLVFTVGDDLEARLSSQEFLRLPSACRCCRRKPFEQN